MHVVIVDEELPYPATSGKRIRILSLARHLAKRHRVTFLCHRNADIGEACEADAWYFQVSWHRGGLGGSAKQRRTGTISQELQFWELGLAPESAFVVPYSVQWASCPRMRAAVRQYHAEHAVDIWQCEWAPYATNLLGITGIRWAMMAHDIQSCTWERYYRTETNPLKKWYIKKQWEKYRRFENRVFSEAPMTITVTEDDELRATEQLSARRTAVVDNGVEVAYYQAPELKRAARSPGDILFLGNLEWRPNLDAVRLLLDEIFPAVRAAEPSAQLCIVGRRPPAWLRRRGRDDLNVEVHADVADVRPFLYRCGAMAVPLRIGGGSRLKILEALACGLPVVASTVGAEGLRLEPGVHFACAGQSAEMAAILIEWIRNPAPALALAEAGRAVVEAQYDWSVLARKMEQAWEEMLSERSAARSVVSYA